MLSNPEVNDEEENVKDYTLGPPLGPSYVDVLKGIDVKFQWLERREGATAVRILCMNVHM